MRKIDLVENLVEVSGLSKRQADNVVSSVLEQITNALARGEPLNLAGFGSFSVRARSARLGRHPKTGAPINISASKQISFRPGKRLKERCE